MNIKIHRTAGGWVIDFAPGPTLVLSDEEYDGLAVKVSHRLQLGLPVASPTGVSAPLNGTDTLLHLCYSDETEVFADALRQAAVKRDRSGG